MKYRFAISFLVVVLPLCFLFSCSGDSGTKFIGAWVEREGGREITIEKKDVYFEIKGFPTLSGNWILNENGTLVAGDGSHNNIQYNKDNDVLIVTENESKVYERKK